MNNDGIRGLANEAIENSMDSRANLIDFSEIRESKRLPLEDMDDNCRTESKAIVIDLKAYLAEKRNNLSDIDKAQELLNRVEQGVNDLGSILKQQTEIDAKDDYYSARESYHVKKASGFLSKVTTTLGKIMTLATRHAKKSVAV